MVYDMTLRLWFLVMLKNEIFGSYFWVVSSWYQSPGLRDSDTLPGVSELKLRGNKKIFKRKMFSKRILKALRKKEIFKQDKGVVHAISRAQVSTPKLPIQVYVMIISFSFSRTTC